MSFILKIFLFFWISNSLVVEIDCGWSLLGELRPVFQEKEEARLSEISREFFFGALQIFFLVNIEVCAWCLAIE